MRCLPPFFLFLTSVMMSALSADIATADENAGSPTIELLRSWIKDHDLNDENSWKMTPNAIATAR